MSRPRLLRSLVGRWDHRITSLVGGPGLGKTTLLSQAIAENRLAPRGDDVWVGLEPLDADADRLARVVTAALTSSGADADGRAAPDQAAPQPAAVADAVWHRAPTEACLVLDDVHMLPVGSTGAKWLDALVGALPANGHVVLASRSDPPFAMTRYGVQGAVLSLFEDDLRFSDDELSGFAARRGLDPAHFGDMGGWPAMAELAASVERRLTGAYLWEEVLEPLGTLRRHVLSVLCDLGGADDALASAAVGTPVRLAEVLGGVPLVARGADGWYKPHALWHTAPGIELSPTERIAIRRRSAEHLNHLGRFDEAFSLIQDAGLWDLAPSVLRSAALASDRLMSSQLGRWLALSPESVRTSSAGRLVEGMHTAFTSPADAVTPLQQAAARCREEGDVDGEMTAIAQLGRLAWWRQDLAALAPLAVRVAELETTGHPTARALARVARAIAADMAGDDRAVVVELRSIEPSVLDPAWEVLATFLLGNVSIDLDEAESTSDIIERLAPTADPSLRAILDGVRLREGWNEGRVDEFNKEYSSSVVAVMKAGGVSYHVIYSSALASIAHAHAGDLVAAKRCLDDAAAELAVSQADSMSVCISLSRAMLELAVGHEQETTAILREALDLDRFEQGSERRLWRRAMPLVYVLLPETRSTWDGMGLRGFLATARDLAAVIVALRAGQGGPALRRLGSVDVAVARAALHHRFAAELAVGLAAIGRSEGRALFDLLGAPGRAVVREMATNAHPQAKDARALLAAVPAPPAEGCYLAVLGPCILRRGSPHGEEVVDPYLRRKRVRELVAFLVGHRRTTRAAIAAALWPDLDERSASNNLGVTLNHLLRLLEPGRQGGEPAYLLRLDGQLVQLVTGEHLRLDVDEFDQHLLAAARAEAEGTPTLALDHHLAAVLLYRNDLHLEVPEAHWLVLDRELYRSRFVGAAVRAGQLLLSRGDAEQAERVAQRALAADQWSEEAYAVLVGAALARGDRSTARRMLDRCLAVLDDLDAEPSSTTQQLRRRVHST